MAANSAPCFEVALVWPVPREVPIGNTPYAVYDRERHELYRGKTDAQGIAHICVAQLPTDATLQTDPDGPGSDDPIRIFPDCL